MQTRWWRCPKPWACTPVSLFEKEAEYKALGTDEFSIEEWADIIENAPILLERPILLNGDQAVIGRPPENVLQLIR